MPKSVCAPPYARRNPVITSSKISSAPSRFVISRKPSRNPGAGGDHTHVRCHRFHDHRCDFPGVLLEKFLHGRQIVIRRIQRKRAQEPRGTPGLAEIPSVASPEPASERKLSACPW